MGAGSDGGSEEGGAMRIDCQECAMEGTEQCRDCVVTFILDREGGPVVVDPAEARALRGLGEAGLVPLLRLRRRRADPGEATG